jgi:hypothetical protein
LGLNEGKLTTFYKIKETFSREFDLDSLCFKQRSILTKFRLSAHSLRIETGRYEKCRDAALVATSADSVHSSY